MLLLLLHVCEHISYVCSLYVCFSCGSMCIYMGGDSEAWRNGNLMQRVFLLFEMFCPSGLISRGLFVMDCMVCSGVSHG